MAFPATNPEPSLENCPNCPVTLTSAPITAPVPTRIFVPLAFVPLALFPIPHGHGLQGLPYAKKPVIGGLATSHRHPGCLLGQMDHTWVVVTKALC